MVDVGALHDTLTKATDIMATGSASWLWLLFAMFAVMSLVAIGVVVVYSELYLD
jgi:hypothetical protein